MCLMKGREIMIGIDFTFIFPGEVKVGYLYRSYELSTAAILDALSELGYSDKFILIVNHYAADFVRNRFPKFKICVVNFPISDIVYFISKGRKSANTWGKKFGAFKTAVLRERIDYLWFPCGLPKDMAYCGVPYLCTVNDIINYHSTKDTSLKEAYKKMIEYSDKIVTISNFVNADVQKNFSVDAQCIYTIPVSIKRPAKPVTDLNLCKKPYILDINGYGPHKNTLTLIRAFENICLSVDYNLCLCGGWKDEHYFNSINRYVIEHGLASRVKIFFGVSSDEKNWLLWNASLFVTPSLNEGFGMTPVEAALCNVPVISTKAASLYEVTMGLVKYIDDPEDVNELAKAMIEVLNAPPNFSALESISNKFEEEYSAMNCAKKYLKLFSLK